MESHCQRVRKETGLGQDRQNNLQQTNKQTNKQTNTVISVSILNTNVSMSMLAVSMQYQFSVNVIHLQKLWTAGDPTAPPPRDHDTH